MNDFLHVKDVVKDYPSGETTLRVLDHVCRALDPAEEPAA